MQTADILVLDFGSQYTQLIARRLREQGVYTELIPFNASIEQIKAKSPKGLILSGGPASVYAKDAYFCDEGIFDLGLPILGICYGMQLIAHKFGGSVIPASHKEYGKAELKIAKNSQLFDGVGDNSVVWMSHADKVEILPKNFEVLATSKSSEYCVFADENRKIYAMQFHPEVIHSEFGTAMLKNFSKICGISSTWNMGSFAK
ncbi:MAG: glutamine-hydrolyzing GMP synthase, partial [Campylobacter sp.]|nr:glutamine-hydrolyzing GMP synthase [Campylobacter sp.]